jgi:hypothetical protein
MSQQRTAKIEPLHRDPSGRDLLETMRHFRQLVRERQLVSADSKRRSEIDRQLDRLRSLIWDRAIPERSPHN